MREISEIGSRTDGARLAAIGNRRRQGATGAYVMYAPTVPKRYRYSDSSPLIYLMPR